VPGERSMPSLNRARWTALVAGVWVTAGRAAGGHFAVDDATILDVGQCQVETWVERGDRASSLLHVGPACRVGPFELGVNADRVQLRDRGPQTPVGPQIKWAAPVDERVSVGFVALAGWQGAAPHYAGATLYAASSARVASSLLANVNLGRDWFRDAAHTWPRGGVSLEWQTAPEWVLIGERFRQAGGDFARLGLRWQESAAISVDLSRAHGVASTPGGSWTIGLNWTFDATRRANLAP
jgi:hypothetical protein